MFDVHWFPKCNTQSLPLANRIVNGTVMGPQNISIRIQECTRYIVLSGVSFQKGNIIAVRDKTDILTVRFSSVDEAIFFCQPANLGLLHVPKGKHCVRQLLLGHGIKYIALILCFVQGFFQEIDAVRLFDTGIMSGHHIVTAKDFCPLKQLVKFHITIAVNAGIRSFTGLICVNETFYDILTKSFFKIEHIIWHPHLIGNVPGIFDIVKAAAGMSAGETNVFVII